MSLLTRRRTRARVLTLVLLLGIACKNYESYVPHLVTIGGAVMQVAALNYLDPNYAPAINLLMGTLTPAAAGMAVTWAQEHKRQEELAELERIEQEIREEQAALERVRAEAAQLAGAAEGVIPRSTPPGATGALAADVALLRVRGDAAPAPIRDGDALHDGRDGQAPEERLRVLVRPQREAYVYVLAIDAVGRVQPLYPSTFDVPARPLPAGHALLLPSADDAYGLDEYHGVQHVFFYASEAPNTALEVQLARFARAPRSAPDAEKIYAVSEPTLIEAGPEAAVSVRGLTNVRPAASVVLGAAGELQIEAERATAQPGESLVVTRWFEHR